MPLYAGIGGAQKEIGEIYAGIGGYAKKLEQLYAGVGGAAKELLPSGYTWKKYDISGTPGLEYVGTANSVYTRYITVSNKRLYFAKKTLFLYVSLTERKSGYPGHPTFINLSYSFTEIIKLVVEFSFQLVQQKHEETFCIRYL